MKKVYLVAAKRTAIGKFLGTLGTTNAVDLAVPVVKQILADAKLNGSELDEVIVGNVLSAGHKQGVTRQLSIKSGIPQEVSAYGINMICGSGMKSVMQAYNDILAGQADLVLSGGTESMSCASYVIPATIRNGVKMGDFNIIDHMILDGLTDAFSGLHMGVTAENIAEKYNISRKEQDDFSYNSQQKAIAAIDAGRFKDEIVPVIIPNKKGDITFDTDEFPNRTSTPEKLANLRPAFKKDGTVTAGNASGINDSASFTLIASEDAVKKYNLLPLVEIIGIGQAGVAPDVMGLGPVPAIKKALTMANKKLTDIEVLELNEAFAAQAIGVMHDLCIEHSVDCEWLRARTNINGGAIALGHPIGASGNRIIVSLIYEMKRANNQLGLASLCIGGGMGTAMVFKNV
ncbi:MAG: acetyl-CoA C-acetyltransferase [Ignavibacteria bacterium]|jgi:acetyl-CoA C-acetyltransferase|nr:acetyl-CoA C-acetyltransferase [Ignavibacteria bacterium]